MAQKIITQQIDLAVQNGRDVLMWPNVLAVKGDSKAHLWRVEVVQNGVAADLSGQTAICYGINGAITTPMDTVIDGNVVSSELLGSCYAEAGTLKCLMKITSGGATTAVAAMFLRVQDGPTDVMVDPESLVPDLSALLAKIDEMETATTNANTATANANEAATEAHNAAAYALASPSAKSAGLLYIADAFAKTEPATGVVYTYTLANDMRIAYGVGDTTASIVGCRIMLAEKVSDLIGKNILLKCTNHNVGASDNKARYRINFTSVLGTQWGGVYGSIVPQNYDGTPYLVSGDAIRASMLSVVAGCTDDSPCYIALYNQASYTSQALFSLDLELQAAVLGTKTGLVYADEARRALAADEANMAYDALGAGGTQKSAVLFQSTNMQNSVVKTTLRNQTRLTKAAGLCTEGWQYCILTYALGTVAEVTGKQIVYKLKVNSFTPQVNATSSRLIFPNYVGLGVSTSQWSVAAFTADEINREGKARTIDILEVLQRYHDAGGTALVNSTDIVYLSFGCEFALGNTTGNGGANDVLAFDAEFSVKLCKKTNTTDMVCADALLGFTKTDADIEELQEAVGTANKYIAFWGDSLTAGGGWTTLLASLMVLTEVNAGTGGENVRTIVARQGADVMIVNNVTIPAGLTPVVIADRDVDTGISTLFGYKVTPLLQGGTAHVNPCKIGNVAGTLTWTGANYSDMTGNWTFTRAVAGDAVVIDRPTALRTHADMEHNAPNLMVIFMGQNGGYTDNADLVRMHRLMIEHSKARHYLVLGLSSGSAASRAEYEAAMRAEFGRYFVSLREYLAHPIYDTDGVTIISCYGLADAGLTATSADLAAIATGTVPPQLLSDGVHYTTACKTVIGNMLYRVCQNLNIAQ